MGTESVSRDRNPLRWLRAATSLTLATALALAVAFSAIDFFPPSSFFARVVVAATTVPGLLLIAEIARRMRVLLKHAEERDPFTTATARELSFLAWLTGLGGLVVWVVGELANRLIYRSPLPQALHEVFGSAGRLLGWLAVALVFAAFAHLIGRGAATRTELDSVAR